MHAWLPFNKHSEFQSSSMLMHAHGDACTWKISRITAHHQQLTIPQEMATKGTILQDTRPMQRKSWMDMGPHMLFTALSLNRLGRIVAAIPAVAVLSFLRLHIRMNCAWSHHCVAD